MLLPLIFEKATLFICQAEISPRGSGRKQRNEILLDQLVTNCTREALITACAVFIAEEGYPKMNALGEVMKKKLERV